MSATEREWLEAAQAAALRSLERAQAALEACDEHRDRMVAEARKLAVPWSAIGAVVGMERSNAHRKWGS